MLIVVSSHTLIFDVDLIGLALVDQSVILVVTNLTLFTRFKLLPGLLLDHSCVSIEVLPLKADLLELLCKASLFLTFLFLLGFNLAVSLKKSLLARCQGLCC
jgi:hypothetical protein